MNINPVIKSLLDPKLIPNKIRTNKQTYKEARARIHAAGLDDKVINNTIKKVVLSHKKSIIKALKTRNYNKLKAEVLATTVESFQEVRGLFTFDKRTPANLLASVLMLVVTIIVSLIITFALTASVSAPVFLITNDPAHVQIIAVVVSTIIVSPIVEELAKFIALKNNMGSEFLLAFNVFEFTGYVMMMSQMGLNIIGSIIIRLITVFMHYNTAQTIKKGIEINQEGMGLQLAMAMHAIYNAVSMVFNSKVVELLGAV